jgi:hypothetical protein
VAFGVSKKIPGFIQAFRDYEKKNRQVDRSMGHVWPSVRMGPDTKNNFLYFFSVEFYCGHFKPIPDEQRVKCYNTQKYVYNTQKFLSECSFLEVF